MDTGLKYSHPVMQILLCCRFIFKETEPNPIPPGGPGAHHPAHWMDVSHASEPGLARGGVVVGRGDAVSADQVASTVSANMVIVAFQLPYRARI